MGGSRLSRSPVSHENLGHVIEPFLLDVLEGRDAVVMASLESAGVRGQFPCRGQEAPYSRAAMIISTPAGAVNEHFGRLESATEEVMEALHAPRES